MKASILLATYNKEACLPNTLRSIALQKTSFPFEVLVTDDCSLISPQQIVKTYLPEAKFYRYPHHAGFVFSQGRGMTDMDPDSDIVVIQSCDVMYLSENVLEELCTSVTPGHFAMAHVRNVDVAGMTLFKSAPLGWHLPGIIHLRNKFLETKGTNIYSGTQRPSGDWLLFLGAMRTEDAFRIGFHENCCDVVVQQKIKENGLKPIFRDDVFAVHQHHPWAHRWPCPVINQCSYWCSRK